MDWDNQPDPFRRYVGAPQVLLELAADRLTTSYAALFDPVGTVPPAPMDGRGVAALFELALGLSAWKAYMEVRWALRCNPSSGNLHPTEGYAILPDIPAPDQSITPDIKAGVYHYQSHDHLLEQRQAVLASSSKAWHEALGRGAFLVGLSSVHWRESWKYGDRAYRYCRLNEGHAVAVFRMAAAALGWKVEVLTAPGDDEIARLLGLDLFDQGGEKHGGIVQGNHDSQSDVAPEAEHPDLLLCIRCPSEDRSGQEPLISKLTDALQSDRWEGVPNRLSEHHALAWPVVEEAADQAWKPSTKTEVKALVSSPPLLKLECRKSAAKLIRQRRSAQRYDGKGGLSMSALFRMLDALLPRHECPPWDMFSWPARLHPVLMIHRVQGMVPGLYALPRRPEALSVLQKGMDRSLLWKKVSSAPLHLPLYLLRQEDVQDFSRMVSCQQEIAADGAFSLGMVAEFDAGLAQGPWGYRNLFWEAGALGQILYLEAEAAGIRGTGIGCYFDDLFHQALGIQGETLQSLYHFTVGVALEDNRLQTDPPYAHLANRF
ncbi:MAG: SagB/ThcOx family dehydrogenase [Magnetococcales bacterium]|nr:SagB/ThcOx family dehydrogenase [Magnetococcales bacterium]